MVFESIIAKYIKCIYVILLKKLKIAFFKVFEIIFSIKKMESIVYMYLKIHTSPGILKTPRLGEGGIFCK